MAIIVPAPSAGSDQATPESVVELPERADGPSIDRFVRMASYHTNLPTTLSRERAPSERASTARVAVELLLDPDAQTYWAVVSSVGVAAVGSTPAEAALAAMRAASALL